MIKFLIISGIVIAAWLIVSRFLAWMFASHPEEVTDLWACFFLLPIMLAILGGAWLERGILQLAYHACLIGKPSDHLGDYLP